MVSTSIRRAAAKKLRANTTPHERILWRALKEIPLEGTHFRRQAPIGPYVVDFFCPVHRLIVEVDGGHHGTDADRERDAWLTAQGYRVLRVWNNDVMENIESVCAAIAVAAQEAGVGAPSRNR